MLLTVAAVVAAGEEISWGGRLRARDTRVDPGGVVYEPYVAGMLLVGLYGSVGSWFVYRVKLWRTANWYLFVPPIFLAGAFLQLVAYRVLRYTGLARPQLRRVV